MTQPDNTGSPRFRVLLVDDEPVMLRLMAAALGNDVDVSTCTSGQQAARLMEQRIFDVVCSDFRMPGMSGVEVLRLAASMQEEASCLLVTGAADEVPAEERRRYYVVIKPFENDRFVRLVGQLARIAQMKRAVKSTPRVAAPPVAERDSRPPPSQFGSEPRSERRPSFPGSGPPSSRTGAPPSSGVGPPSSFGAPRSKGGSGGPRR